MPFYVMEEIMNFILALILLDIGFTAGILYLCACIDLGASKEYRRRDEDI